MNNKSTLYYNRIAKKYEDLQYNSAHGKLATELIWSNVERFLPKEKDSLILDAGGGTGFFARRLARLGYRVVSTDIAKNILEVAETLAKEEGLQSKIQFVFSDITNMKEFEDNTFDFVISNRSVVSYSLNPRRAIRELGRVAKKGAYVCVDVHGFSGSGLKTLVAKRNFKGIERLAKTHLLSDLYGGFGIRYFTVDEIKELFRKNNLEVVDVSARSFVLAGYNDEERDKILSDPKTYRTVKRLELRFSRNPLFIGTGSIRLVGKK
jgi:ubiquinone/menaquinone biosynthesis C-methylase UbiE